MAVLVLRAPAAAAAEVAPVDQLVALVEVALLLLDIL
jgi:hypothetical protein